MRDAAWAEEPCARQWTLDRRPCAWFRAGRNCGGSWRAEAPPVADAVQVAALAALAAMFVSLARALGTARARRKARGDANWNASESVTACLLAAAALQLLCWTDLDGYARLHFPVANDFLALGVRYCFELALFRACEAYRAAMDGLLASQRSPRRRASALVRSGGNAWAGSARWAFAVVAGLWTLAFAVAQCFAFAPRDRGKCWDLRLSSTFYGGVTAAELYFIGECYGHCARVRGQLLAPPPGRGATSDATKRLLARLHDRLAALVVVFLGVAAWAVYACARNGAGLARGRTTRCHQPPCTRGRALEWLLGWAGYVVVTGLGCLAVSAPGGLKLAEAARDAARALRRASARVRSPPASPRRGVELARDAETPSPLAAPRRPTAPPLPAAGCPPGSAALEL